MFYDVNECDLERIAFQVIRAENEYTPEEVEEFLARR
jgi:hypothetical protein